MTTTKRSNGLDNPLSPNSGSLTWRQVEARADESPAVESYSGENGIMEIEWCDGTTESFSDPTAANNAIRAMEAN